MTTRMFETVQEWEAFRRSPHRASTTRDHNTRSVPGCMWCDRLRAIDAEILAAMPQPDPSEPSLWEVPITA